MPDRVGAPTLLLLHGYPSASHQFRELIPLLADPVPRSRPRPCPGLRQVGHASRGREFGYTFEHLSGVIDRWTEVVGLERFALYVFDYGAPVGFRMDGRHPERVSAIITQNGNVSRGGAE